MPNPEVKFFALKHKEFRYLDLYNTFGVALYPTEERARKIRLHTKLHPDEWDIVEVEITEVLNVGIKE